jgi:hypothetical protein
MGYPNSLAGMYGAEATVHAVYIPPCNHMSGTTTFKIPATPHMANPFLTPTCTEILLATVSTCRNLVFRVSGFGDYGPVVRWSWHTFGARKRERAILNGLNQKTDAHKAR